MWFDDEKDELAYKQIEKKFLHHNIKLWNALGVDSVTEKEFDEKYYWHDMEEYRKGNWRADRQIRILFDKICKQIYLEEYPEESDNIFSTIQTDKQEKLSGNEVAQKLTSAVDQAQKFLTNAASGIKSNKKSLFTSAINKFFGAVKEVINVPPPTSAVGKDPEREGKNGLGDIFSKKYKKIFDIFVPAKYREYAIDYLNKQPLFSYSVTSCRFTVRSPHKYLIKYRTLMAILKCFYDFNFFNCDLITWLKKDLSRFQLALIDNYAPLDNLAIEAFIVPLLDRQNPQIISYIIEILTSDTTRYSITPNIVRAIVQSDRTELIDLLIQFLLKAGLQEGVRQCICENMDAGTWDAQCRIFKAIYENDLNRFSSVKRALATQTGIYRDDESVERTSDKVLELLNDVLTNSPKLSDYLKSDNALECYMALWGMIAKDIDDIDDVLDDALENNRRCLLLTAADLHTQNIIKMSKIARKVIAKYPGDNEILGAWFGLSIPSLFVEAFYALYKDGIPNWETDDFDRNLQCKHFSYKPWFNSEQEVRECFHWLDQLIRDMPKEGYRIKSAILSGDSSWRKEHILERMFALAYMLKDTDPSLMDEIAPRYKEMSEYLQDDCFLMIVHNATTPKRKKILFEGLKVKDQCNRIYDYAVYFINKLQLTDDDCLELCDLFRYKSRRVRDYLFERLMKESDNTLIQMIEKLTSGKNKEMRAAGLFFAERLKKDMRTAGYEAAKQIVCAMENPDDSEKPIVDSICEDPQKNTETIADSLFPTFDKNIRTPLPPSEHFTNFMDYINAYRLKQISRDEVYQAMSACNLKTLIRSMSPFVKETELLRQTKWYHSDDELEYEEIQVGSWRYFDKPNQSIKHQAITPVVQDFYWTITEPILKVELKRSEATTQYSSIIGWMPKVRGTQTLVDILVALGKDKIDRKADTFLELRCGYSYEKEYDDYTATKNYCLSRLIYISEPWPNEDGNTLKECLNDKKISNERLIEVAMFNDRWVSIIEQYLGWNGLESGIYYFAAHMDEEFSEQKSAKIARFSPIPTDDFKQGAFDLNWFREVRNNLGEDHLQILYKSAKFLSNANKHTRARKYADAEMGKLAIAETEKTILEKRNKDLLMAYCIIPIADKADVLHRYLFIQKFRKSAKDFGAQRRNSETLATKIALRNLAQNFGLQDEMRLIMNMESELVENWKPYFEWQTLSEDVEIRITHDESYSFKMECRKDGKLLKSVPSKLNKTGKVLEFREVLAEMRDQQSRSRLMLEEFMENRTELTLSEIQLLLNNILIAPMVSKLVFMKGSQSLYFTEDEYITPDLTEGHVHLSRIEASEENAAKLRIAHPYDLYTTGEWPFWQRYLFEHQIKQPFKQVFRELYLVLPEERECWDSMRFAGHQVYIKKVIGCLKSRHWVADYEEGLMKVYYKENIIAKIFAECDWYSPSDIEPPTLESVQFFNRETWEPIELKDVPPIIFSEVMRDVDMAVSVAHAGGVDPETSLSTIDMRKVIAEYNVKLFKLKNVTFTNRHALIKGQRASYKIHLGSGGILQDGVTYISILPVHSQHKGRLFLPFIDEDPKTAEIMSKIILFADDIKIKDPYLLDQINKNASLRNI